MVNRTVAGLPLTATTSHNESVVKQSLKGASRDWLEVANTMCLQQVVGGEKQFNLGGKKNRGKKIKNGISVLFAFKSYTVGLLHSGALGT